MPVSPFGRVADQLSEMAKEKRQRSYESPSRALQQATALAQLSEMGYTPQMNSNSVSLSRDPNYVSKSQMDQDRFRLEKEKFGLDSKKYGLEERKLEGQLRVMDSFGGGGTPGTFGAFGNIQSDQPFVMDPLSMKLMPNPSYMSEVDRLKLDSDKRKYEEEKRAESDRNEAFRRSSEDTLKTIQNVKDGSKYFGYFGNIDSKFDLPTLLNREYGKRKDWEANINKLLSQKILDVMNEMKRVSKTGATGFGALSERELGVIQNSSTALQRDLPEDKALEYLNDMEEIYNKLLSGSNSGQQVPVWVPQGYEENYKVAIQNGFTDDEITQKLKERGLIN